MKIEGNQKELDAMVEFHKGNRVEGIPKIHSRLPAAMEFWLVCLVILAYSCQNTSQDSGV